MAKTYQEILSEMCARVTKCSVMEGSFIYTALAPYAMELADLYLQLESDENNGYADTANYEYLKKLGKDRGLYPTEATYAVGIGKFDKQIATGTRFQINTFVWVSGAQINNTNDTSYYYYTMTCETAGTTPNETIGVLEPVSYIEGLSYAYLTSITVPGEDEEDEDSFRERYYATFNKKAFGGNRADYEDKVNSYDGVGGCKVYPIWAGGGTVRIVVINSDYGVPSSTLITSIQNDIDPEQDGYGDGYAPIGHKVTIAAVEKLDITIKANITCDSTHTFSGIKETIVEAVKAYFKNSLSKVWDDSDYLTVRAAQVQSTILNVEGVIDCTNVVINSLSANQNLELDADEIPNLVDVVDTST